MKYAFGVDIGGTQIKYGVFTDEGKLLKKWTSDTDISDSGKRIIPSVIASVKKYLSDEGINISEVAGIGMGVPGPVLKDGYVKVCPNLFWKDFNPVLQVQKELGVPAFAGNDANMAALGEYYKGAGKDYESMMLVTLGTGVGGGIIIDGNVIGGAHGMAGEIGHVTVMPDYEEKCNCKNRGCTDQIASATGIVNISKKLLNSTDKPSKLRDRASFDAKVVCDLAKENDPVALCALETCMGALGKGLAYFAHAFDPDAFIIGGGVSKAGDILISLIEKSLKSNIFLTDDTAHVSLAKLGNDAGIIGCAMQVIQASK